MLLTRLSTPGLNAVWNLDISLYITGATLRQSPKYKPCRWVNLSQSMLFTSPILKTVISISDEDINKQKKCASHTRISL